MSDLVKLCRPQNAIPALLWLLIGYSAAGGNNYSGLGVSLMLVGLTLLNFFATTLNDLVDLPIDIDSKRETALIKGQVSVKKLTTFTYLLALVAICLPLLFGQIQLALLLGVYLLVCCLYNLYPFLFSRRPVLSIITLGLCFSTLPAVYGLYIANQSVNWPVILLIIGGFLFRISISSLKDYKDYSADKKHSKQTFLLKFGPRKLRQLSLASHALGSLLIITSIVLLLGFKFEVIIILVALAIFAYFERFKLGIEEKQYKLNNLLFHRLAAISLLFESGVLLCFYIY